MNIKSLLMIAALCLSTMFVANAKNPGVKTYEVLISEPTTVGKVLLPRGEYKLKLDGENVTLVSADGSKTATTVVKIETAKSKADQTHLVTDKKSDGTLHILEIDLGGSTVKLIVSE